MLLLVIHIHVQNSVSVVSDCVVDNNTKLKNEYSMDFDSLAIHQVGLALEVPASIGLFCFSDDHVLDEGDEGAGAPGKPLTLNP